MVTKNTYNPDYAVHPGEYLKEVLDSRGMLQKELAEKCKMSYKAISQIINKKNGIKEDTAIKFERVLGIPAYIWLAFDKDYKLHSTRKQLTENCEVKEWIKNFPLKDLRRNNIISTKGNILEEILKFLGIGSIDAFDSTIKKICVNYRKSKSHTSSKYSLSTWLKFIEMQAKLVENVPCYDRFKFASSIDLIKEAIYGANPSTYTDTIKKLLFDCGVILLFIPEFKGACVNGSALWINNYSIPVIALSLRGKKDDIMLFTLFHEIAHVLQDDKKNIYVDQEDGDLFDDKEKNADCFARDTLIDPVLYKQYLYNKGYSKKESILEFSKKSKVPPSVLVGRLQHEGRIRHINHNDLRIKVDIVENKVIEISE